jgi:hypothetical protein
MSLAAARRCSVVAVVALSIPLNGGPQAAQSPSGRQSPPGASAGAIAITDVTVIDVRSGAKQAGVTVVTNGGEIAGIGRAVPVPPGAVRVDGAGKVLIPGLWDMHSHNQASGAESLDLYLAHGVVGTRDMGSDLDFILPLRDRIQRGEASGPEIVAAGPMLDNAPADWPFRRRVTNAQEAREAVRDLKRRGVDFIKVHNNTPREVFFAIAEEAPKLGLPFAGHIPFAVTIAEGASSGMRTIEHFSESRVFRECAGTPQPYDAGRCRPLFDDFATRGIWQTPTLAFFRALPDVFSGPGFDRMWGLTTSRQVEIVPNRRVHALVAVAFHQGFDVTALGFAEIVLDGQRADLILLERKAFQCMELPSFDIQAHIMNASRSLRAFEDVRECHGRELDRPGIESFVFLHRLL